MIERERERERNREKRERKRQRERPGHAVMTGMIVRKSKNTPENKVTDSPAVLIIPTYLRLHKKLNITSSSL